MSKRTFKGLVCAVVSIFFLHPAFSQEKIAVCATAFNIVSPDSAYIGLKSKLPKFVCGGILYNSSLDLTYIPEGNPFLPLDFSSYSTSPDYNNKEKNKRILDSLHVKFILKGELNINYGQFYMKVTAADGTDEVISYQSKLKPLDAFPATIDEACAELNYKIKMRLMGQRKARNILVSDFQIHIPKNVYISYNTSNAEVYAPDFPSRYIASNLKSSTQYAVLPYHGIKNINDNAVDSIADANADIQISGVVDFDGKGYCSIYPIVLFPGDRSVPLPGVKDIVSNRDEILTITLGNIQSLLDAAINSDGSITMVNNEFANPADYEKAFDSAVHINNLALAFFYANSLSLKFSNQETRAGILKAIVYYKQNNYIDALENIRQSLVLDSLDKDANYYAALISIKSGRYEIGKSYLKKVSSTLSDSDHFPDLFYQYGLCLYNQDSVEKSLSNFKNQEVYNYMAAPALYYYMSKCYKELNQWEIAEKYLLKQYMIDSSVVTQKQLSDFYTEYGGAKYASGSYTESYTYYRKAYSIFKTYESLFGQVESLVKGHVMDTVQLGQMIQDAISSNIPASDYIYLDIAELLRTQVDTAGQFIPYYLRAATSLLRKYVQTNGETTLSFQRFGSTYFRLLMLDSAEYYYKKVKQMQPDDPVNYFNLAELQIMQLKADSALRTLQDLAAMNSNSPVFSGFYSALYNFYTIEGKILKKQSYWNDLKTLRQTLKKYDANNKEGLLLFNAWSFKTFYKWIKNNSNNLEPSRQRLLMNNLCTVLEYSRDRELPCLLF